MRDDKVRPLFSPSFASYEDAQFIANIGDELSLWRILGQGLRIYPDNMWGYWVLGLREKLAAWDLNATSDPRAIKTMRHIDAIEVYAAMVGERLTDAT